MTHSQYKCQVQGKESFIDNLFVIFSQSYLINQVQAFHKEKGHDSKNRVKLLELGCYNGRVMHFMTQQMLFVTYTGVDVTQKYLSHSPVQRRKDVTLLCEDVTKGLSVTDGSQDMIISSEVLEHINPEDLPGVIQTLYNKLKIGGRICVAFPMNTKDKMYHNLEKEKGLGHVNFPVYDDFIELCENIGFTLNHYDSGFTLKSSYRVPNYKDPLYKKIRNRLGSPVARAIWMTIDDNHTGGGYFTFDKLTKDAD
jgi:predicted SAM-dependent methyltransferase